MKFDVLVVTLGEFFTFWYSLEVFIYYFINEPPKYLKFKKSFKVITNILNFIYLAITIGVLGSN